MAVKNQKTSKRWTRARLIGSIRMKARMRPRKSQGPTQAMHLRWPISAHTTVLVAGGLTAAALFIVWLQPSPRAEDRTASLPYNLPGPARSDTNRSRPFSAVPATLPRTSAARGTSRKGIAEPDAVPEAAVDPEPGYTNGQTDARQAAVTITGCLERDDETFRLRDTTGTDAPKARSWRSGFLKKHAAAVDLVDAGGRARLPNYVGQRVTATGLLVNREMQVRSLQRVATSCG
jgi:hypothetical protein